MHQRLRLVMAIGTGAAGAPLAYISDIRTAGLSMARFLFAIWPFVGHINPFMPVAAALRARGHDIAFYTARSAQSVIEGEGFGVFPFQRTDEQRAWNAVMVAEAAAAGERSKLAGLRAFRDWVAGTVQDQVADLQPIVRTWKPHVLISETAMWGPMLVTWESTGVPVAVASTLLGSLIPGPQSHSRAFGIPAGGRLGRLLVPAANALTDLLASGMRRDLNRVRARYGLPPMRGSVNSFTARLPLYLVPSLPELDYLRSDLPPSVHYVGACVWSKPSGMPAAAWLKDLPTDRPIVHVTEGTVHYQDPFVLRAAARGLAGRPVQVVLTTGLHRDPATLQLGPPAANVRVERWVPHADLLPHCAVLVTTGGAGTVMAALQAGVPLVIVPTLWDKVDNARRVEAAAVGLSLAPGLCTPDRLRAAVEHVLGDPRFRTNARRMAKRLAAAPGPSGAAALLEDLASQPQTPAKLSTHNRRRPG